jgi:EmrB/QacA subfamily drug resistance transporter
MTESLTEYPRRWAALAVLSLTLVATTLDNSVLNTALPSLARSLDASTSDLQWITNAYTLVFASALILAGGIGARLGSRRALIGGLVTFGAGSAIAALSNSPELLIVWRAVMGLGAAFIMPATLAIITRIFTPAERPKAYAVWSAAAGIGVVIGPVTGGLLLERYSWSSAFWINVPLVVVALVAVLFLVPNVPTVREGRLDVLGAVLVTGAVALLVDFIIQAPDRGWTDTLGLVELVSAVVLGALFLLWQLKATWPLVRLDLFANRTFLVAALSLSVVFFVMFGMLFEVTQYLQLVKGFSPLKAGLGGTPFAIGMAITAVASAFIAKRLSVRWIIVIGLTMCGIGVLVMSTSEVSTPYWHVLGANAIIGLGMGMMMAPASLQINNSVPPQFVSMASALNSVIREFGGVLGIAVIGTVTSAAYKASPDLPLGGMDVTKVHVAARSLPPDASRQAIEVADRAFTAAMDRGILVGAGLVFVTALLVAVIRPAANPVHDAGEVSDGPQDAPVELPAEAAAGMRAAR